MTPRYALTSHLFIKISSHASCILISPFANLNDKHSGGSLRLDNDVKKLKDVASNLVSRADDLSQVSHFVLEPGIDTEIVG